MKKALSHLLIISLALILCNCTNTEKESFVWNPVGDKIKTKWAEEIDPSNPLPEYPRPQMQRKEWQNLNGLWDYIITDNDEDLPKSYDGKILVPYAIESSLSGVGKTVGYTKTLWYHRTFKLKSKWKNKRIILNLGAIDWQSTVFINGKLIGSHKGGYDPFSYDITDALLGSGEQEILIRVWDPTNANNYPYPRGKQVIKPGGIFYTSVTGIWQTVWLEPVEESYIKSYKLVPDIDKKFITIKVEGHNTENCKLILISKKGKFNVESDEVLKSGIFIYIEDQKLWSPESPFLYDLELILLNEKNKSIDKVDAYFGMRKSSMAKDEKGVLRLFLNNEPVFHFGPLDQGWWPDGLYTAPTDEALKFDLEYIKDVGFNMLRKHVKSEPDRLYYWCDKMGIMVWQDMPSSLYDRDKYSAKELESIDALWDTEWKGVIDYLFNHPSIVMWVPFNEGWGQHDTERITEWTKKYDPSRLVNNASGWTDKNVGDVHDIHNYPDPRMIDLEEDRAIVLGEFGGLGWPVKDHVWVESETNWGYRSHEGKEQYKNDYISLITKLKPLIKKGLAAAIYTQTSDCEVEVNGLLTYDRAIKKLEPEEINSLNNFYLPPEFTNIANSFLGEISVGLKVDDKKAEIRYTIDGSDPTSESEKYSSPIILIDDRNVKARAFWKNGLKSTVVTHTYTNYSGKIIEAVKPEIKKSGVKYDLYKGMWQNLPDFENMKPAKTENTKFIDLSCTDLTQEYALRFTGYIKVPQTSVYTFSVDSDDGTKFYVADQEIITNDGIHGMKEISGEIALEEGWHNIKLMFFQGRGGQGLKAYIQGAGMKKQIISENLLGN